MHAPSPNDTGADPVESCTLPPTALQERLAWIRAEILPHALQHERSEESLAWELDDVPGLAAKLDQLVALEADCCSRLVFAHAASAVPGRRRLEVRGIDPEAGLLAAPPSPPRASLLRRLARAWGLGVVASLFVCCVLPVVAAAGLGATLAAPVAKLDDPWAIAGVSLLFGGAAWLWERRGR